MMFQRIGGLSLTRQKGYKADMPTFHCPPMRKGVYAFPVPYFVWFLLGGSYSAIGSKNAKWEYKKDEDGKRIKYDDEYARVCKMLEDGVITEKDKEKRIWNMWSHNGYLTQAKNIRKFEYNGVIWHHLDEQSKPGDILDRKGSWSLSEIDVYEKLFKREEHDMMKKSAKIFAEWGEVDFANGMRNIYNVDHMEVFISEKI